MSLGLEVVTAPEGSHSEPGPTMSSPQEAWWHRARFRRRHARAAPILAERRACVLAVLSLFIGPPSRPASRRAPTLTVTDETARRRTFVVEPTEFQPERRARRSPTSPSASATTRLLAHVTYGRPERRRLCKPATSRAAIPVLAPASSSTRPRPSGTLTVTFDQAYGIALGRHRDRIALRRRAAGRHHHQRRGPDER